MSSISETTPTPRVIETYEEKAVIKYVLFILELCKSAIGTTVYLDKMIFIYEQLLVDPMHKDYPDAYKNANEVSQEIYTNVSMLDTTDAKDSLVFHAQSILIKLYSTKNDRKIFSPITDMYTMTVTLWDAMRGKNANQ